MSLRTAVICAAAISAFLITTVTPAAAGQIKLRAQLGQKVLVSGGAGKAYVRVDLEGLALTSSEKRTPANVAIVIDRSGSMGGQKIEQAKTAAIMAINRLGRDDFAAVVAYNHDVNVIVPATRVSGHAEMAGDIRRLRAGGRTALYAGTVQGVREVRKFLSDHRVNRVILLSDGLANVGPSRPEDLAELARKVVREGISVSTIGLGLGYNEDLMAKLAYNSDGNHAFVEKADDLVKIFNQEFGDVLSVVAQDLIITIECRGGFRPKRVLGRSADITGDRVRLHLNQIYGKQEKYFIVELEVPKGKRAGETEIADVTVDYKSMAGGARETVASKVAGRFSASEREAKASIDKDVMTAVTTQIANEVNERAVSLRDKGKIGEAGQLLRDNAAYLGRAATALSAPALATLSKKNLDDAKSVASRSEWRKTRKAMRARQHKLKVQQSY